MTDEIARCEICGEGHFERYHKGWRVQHAECAIAERKATAYEEAARQEGEKAKS